MVRFYLSPRPDKQGECPIRVSISIRGSRLVSTAGYNIAPDKWNKADQRVKKGHYNADKVPANIINARLKAIDSFFSSYEIGINHRPSNEELSDKLASIKGTTRRIRTSEDQETALDFFDRFIHEESRANQWAEGTLLSWQTSRRHLRDFEERVQLSYFDDNGLSKYIFFLRTKEKLSETSVQKEIKHLRWFIRWCIKKGYTKTTSALDFNPKFRIMPKPVIFLTRNELLTLYRYQIPTAGTLVELTDLNGNAYTKTITHPEGLNIARDIFCFCAFTSLRYSDAMALKKSAIVGRCINVVTKKTQDALTIELNDYAAAILDKYAKAKLFDNKALPGLSIQKLGSYIKDLGELCGFNEAITRTSFVGGKRVETTHPKWELLSSHAGRRTFICYALSVGIPPQVVMKWTGHSDYKAMQPYIDVASGTRQKAMAEMNADLIKQEEE